MIKNRVKEIMEKRGLNYKFLWRHSSISGSYARKIYENELTNMTLKTVDELCRVLHVTVDELIYIDDGGKAVDETLITTQ